jgi:predicted nucleic acid-binding Zn ribbon protein
MAEKPVCKYCSKPISGRIDKKFCSDSCRSSFHIDAKKDKESVFQNINKILKKNREILYASSGPEKLSYIHELDLARKGFDFKYITSIHLSENGKTYFFCYDICYSKNGNSIIMIVKPLK